MVLFCFFFFSSSNVFMQDTEQMVLRDGEEPGLYQNTNNITRPVNQL